MWRYEYFIDERRRITFNISEKKFALSYLYFFRGAWVCVARIDDYPHKGKNRGCHIHRLGLSYVEYREMDIDEAHKTLKTIAENIIGDMDEDNPGR